VSEVVYRGENLEIIRAGTHYIVNYRTKWGWRQFTAIPEIVMRWLIMRDEEDSYSSSFAVYEGKRVSVRWAPVGISVRVAGKTWERLTELEALEVLAKMLDSGGEADD